MWQLPGDCQGCELKLVGLRKSLSSISLLSVARKGLDWSCLEAGELDHRLRSLSSSGPCCLSWRLLLGLGKGTQMGASVRQGDLILNSFGNLIAYRSCRVSNRGKFFPQSLLFSLSQVVHIIAL